MQKWNKDKNGEMNFENICRLYSLNKNLVLENQPPFIRSKNVKGHNKNYSVRWNRYQKDAGFSSESFGANYFVLKGVCEIIFDKKTHKFQEGDCFELPKGSYEFKNVGEDFFEYVAVYELPDDFKIDD